MKCKFRPVFYALLIGAFTVLGTGCNKSDSSSEGPSKDGTTALIKAIDTKCGSASCI